MIFEFEEAPTRNALMKVVGVGGAGGNAVTRMIDMGVEPYMVASALRGILAPRLMRQICPDCKAEHQPDTRQKLWLQNMADGRFVDSTFYRGTGCYHCRNTGYQGRIGVYEWLELDETMLIALRNQDHNGFITAARANPNFKTMEELALEFAEQCVTDLEEVFRISIDLDDFGGDRPHLDVDHLGEDLG